MTTTYDRDKSARLVAEAKEDDARMTPGPWEVGENAAESAATLRARPCIRGHAPQDPVDVIVPFGRAYSDASGIARARNNLADLADQLEAAKREHDHWHAQTMLWRDEYGRLYSDNAHLKEMLEAERRKVEQLVADANGQRARCRLEDADHADVEASLTAERDALRAEVSRLTEELGHATAADGDWLSQTSRRMCETMLGDRDALRIKVRELTAEVERLRPVVEASISLRRCDSGEGSKPIVSINDTDDLAQVTTIADAEQIASDNARRSHSALTRWRNAVDVYRAGAGKEE